MNGWGEEADGVTDHFISTRVKASLTNLHVRNGHMYELWQLTAASNTCPELPERKRILNVWEG